MTVEVLFESYNWQKEGTKYFERKDVPLHKNTVFFLVRVETYSVPTFLRTVDDLT